MLIGIVAGGIYGRALPDPIPNSEVKTVRANDTLSHDSGKVGSRPLMINPPKSGGFFFFDL